MIPELILASRNNGKRAEIEHMLAGTVRQVRALSADDADVEETGTTFYENALLKANAAFARYRIPVLADDSGLTVDSLGGAPGVRSARYAGVGASPAAMIAKLLGEMQGFGDSKRSAQFRCTLVLILADGMHAVFEGIIHGKIITAPRGSGGFGYDPVFIPNGYTRTFAEMSAEEKNFISHRGTALIKLKRFLAHLGGD